MTLFETLPFVYSTLVRPRVGVPGIDEILHGGLIPNRLYLGEGDPRSGKTTLALQFLPEGARLSEQGLYIALSETKNELVASATSHGWSLDGIEIMDLTARARPPRRPPSHYVHPSEVD